MVKPMEFGTANQQSATKENSIILLTGCIDPKGMSYTKLQNPVKRREQYLKAISYYLDNFGLPVVFIENSNVDITPYLPNSIDKNRLEVITFDGNNFKKSLGKGYGEMCIVNEAIEQSSFFRDANFVFKITGRHIVLNFKSLIEQYNHNSNIDVLVDLRDMGKYADSRCWGASTRFITQVFVKYHKDINDEIGVNFEHVLAKAVHDGISSDYKFMQLRNLPRLRGSSGTENKKFNDSWVRWFPRDLVHQLKYLLIKR